ncbi:hypothetical protein SAMN05192574_108159 [Mucilaginibacter gossypiicola]|uniref:Uncharacterized protein n=1 Tax=Mucilaginibacter gossypiicola TaxID=551995 RepID=A0A1H8PVV2_9SPHI|nr:hypothetical protein [Mucilaginibacter gossypiicola]SEO45878.1 hypothetical protein SAMN05192574_108159 [Mucilaginibacter gossypiicola]
MEHKTINTSDFLKTISWLNDSLIDWADAAREYTMDGRQIQHSQRSYIYSFNGAITSESGEYAFIYQKLGTKGLLLKNGELLREINRSYYCADVYEYPATFITIEGITYLVHCPSEYCRLDFENAETGEIITDVSGRNPSDFFHSRLEVSPSGKYLMSKGWHWHPCDHIEVFKIKDCINNPVLLDNSALFPKVTAEVCTASFINDTKVLIGSSDEIFNNGWTYFPEKHIAIWDLTTNQISVPVKVGAEFGNLFSINGELAWDTFKFPKIININTGEVLEKAESVNSGGQRSSIVNKEELAQIVFNSQTKQLAIANGESIEILTP